MFEQAAAESRELAASAHEVWSFRLDFSTLSRYNPAVTNLEQLTAGSGVGGKMGEGAVYAFDLSMQGTTRRIELTVTSVVEDEEIAASMVGAVRAREVFRIEEISAASCRALLELWTDIPEGMARETAHALLSGGQQQIASEMDAIAAIFNGKRR